MTAAAGGGEALFVGLISGTSMDGVDAALVRFPSERRVDTLAATTTPYPADLRARLLDAIAPGAALRVDALAGLDIEVARRFAQAALDLLARHGVAPAAVRAIGSHGQTLYHHPAPPHPCSWQIGDAATIAAMTGIATVADFRSLDVALGGEGAPLVPPFHAWCLHPAAGERVVLNLGGIANLSLLDGAAELPRAGFDTGPGNCLLDEWCRRHRGQPYDANGAWAATGRVLPELLDALLADPYFRRVPPKSTGREAFNLAWLDGRLAAAGCTSAGAADVQATLVALTVETVARAIDQHAHEAASAVYVCGGGAANDGLLAALGARLAGRRVATTAALGLNPDYVEASAFAWLARQRLAGTTIPLATARAARRVLLGAVYEARVEPIGTAED